MLLKLPEWNCKDCWTYFHLETERDQSAVLILLANSIKQWFCLQWNFNCLIRKSSNILCTRFLLLLLFSVICIITSLIWDVVMLWKYEKKGYSDLQPHKILTTIKL